MPLSPTPQAPVELPPPPPSLPPWAKVLWYIAETVGIGLGWKLFDYGASILAAPDASGDEQGTEWRRLSVHWDDTTSAEAADDQYHTCDIVNYTNGSIDSTWNSSDETYVAAAMGNFVAAIGPNVCNRYQAKQVRSYRMAFNPYSNPKPFAESGPPVHQLTVGTVGSGGSAIAPQICSTISERTADRKHWGRTYLPTLGASRIDVNGRLTVAAVDSLAAAYEALVTELHAQEFFLVVPTTQSHKAPMRSLQSISEIAVDDIADVHRSRRHKNATHRKILPTPPPLAALLPA